MCLLPSRRWLVGFGMAVVVAHSTSMASAQGLEDLGFGIALSFRWNILEPDLVDEASVDANGIVRVDKRANTNAGFMLEMHYLPIKWNGGRTGIGPFVAAQPGTDQVISAIGMGGMVAWKVSDDKDSRKGFALGVGYAAIPIARVLGSEFQDGKPAPIGPDGESLPIRFQDRDKGSILAMCAFTF